MLRAGSAASNAAADHIEVTRLAPAQIPPHLRRKVLICAGSGGTRDFLSWLAKPGRRLAYSAEFTITAEIADAIGKILAAVWTPTYDVGGKVWPGAWVAEITGRLLRPRFFEPCL